MRGRVKWAAAVDTEPVANWATYCCNDWARNRGVSDPLGPPPEGGGGRKRGVAHAPIRHEAVVPRVLRAA